VKISLSILLLVFSLQSFTKADDIKDFQIEGMSIGDSALDYYTKKELKNFIKTYYPKSKKFYLLEIEDPKYKVYDGVQFAFKKKDKAYIIYGLNGFVFYETKFNQCLKKKKEIESELNQLFKNSNVVKGEGSHSGDPSGKSKQWQTQYILNDKKGAVSIDCIDWHKKITKEEGFTDNLSIAIYSKEYENFVRYEAY
tara:strand:+ start:90 stop:677 length:588 start_codon:yes stop_codon:yes gene_type:complete